MNDYLKHYGVLGMKWGIRRYQNPDGTLTEAGRAKYGKISDKIHKQNAKLTKKENKYRWKAAKYNVKSARKEKKIYKRLSKGRDVPRRMAKKKIKWTMKAAKLTIKAEKKKRKIYKNERLISMINSAMTAIPKETIDKGRDYVKKNTK